MQEPQHRYTHGYVNTAANSFIFRGSDTADIRGEEASSVQLKESNEAAFQVLDEKMAVLRV